jgi:hypothetical protein
MNHVKDPHGLEHIKISCTTVPLQLYAEKKRENPNRLSEQQFGQLLDTSI